MKKWLIFSFLALIIFSSLIVYAQEAQTTAISNQTKVNVPDTSKVVSSVEKVLEKDIVIPRGFKTIGKILLGVKPDEKVELQMFAVIIAVWFMLFMILAEILNFMPFMNKGASKWIGALIMTCLAGISGGLKLVALFFFDLGGLFGLFEKIWAPLRVLIVIVTFVQIAIILWATSWVTRLLRFKIESTQVEQVGEEAGLGIKLARIFGKTTKEELP